MKKFFVLYLCLVAGIASAQDTVTIVHARYTTTFDRQLLYPVKVHWVVNKTDVCDSHSAHHVNRTDDFRADPALATYTNLLPDYHSGSAKYDRGHNMDAADNSCDLSQMHECFYFSNMTAQTKHLNEQTWKMLEERTRDLANQYGRVEVWCGSYGNIEKIGRVTVPAFCWKIIKYNNNTVEAYIFPNTSTVNQNPYTFYKKTVAEVRAKSHLPLPGIPNQLSL